MADYEGRHAADEDAARLTRHEEELQVGTRTEIIGSLRVRKTVESGRVSDIVPRDVESAEPVRTPPLEQDSGEIVTLPDGSVSVPVFEEELVVTKRLVVRERIVIQKHRVTEDARVEAELLRERVDVEADSGIVEEPGDG
jgi:stress response protein YsnF